MRIHMPNQVVELENKRDSADEVSLLIKEYTEKQNMLYSHMMLGHREIYEDPHEYIIEHWNEIGSIELVFKTPKEYTGDVLLSTGSYLLGAIPEVRVLVKACYKGLNDESWGNLGKFVEGLQWINHVLTEIKQGRYPVEQTEPYAQLYSRLENILPQLAAAIEQPDAILIGDTLNYEMVPLMESIQAVVQTTIDNEVPRHDIN